VRPPRRKQVEPAARLVRAVLAAHGIADEVREHRLVTQWAEVVGPRVAARTWPDGLSGGVLWVRVVSSSWLQELSFVRDAIAAQANQLLGAPLVDEVRFHLGERRGNTDRGDVVAALARRPPSRPVRKRVFTAAAGERLRAIEQETAAVEDREVRDAITALRRRIGL
jgi:predicted nucleic acid-binding Zn ribbon protein